MSIFLIKDFIQSYVKAIAAIVNVGVTVVDKNLVRIGGTNLYSEQLGKTINHASFYREIIATGKPGMMTKSSHSACQYCDFTDDCSELADLAYPIFYEGKVEGVIGLVAFSESAKQHLLANKTQFENFLQHMTALLESKLLTEQRNAELEAQLDTVLSMTKIQQNQSRFIGVDPKIISLLEFAERVCNSDSTILITGESGTGKDVLAKTIHEMSNRSDRMMVSVNCGAIPENLIESELFGYEGGAFTGANKQGLMGKFELANNSTLLLDEIGEMPLSAQTKLLRVLQERVIQRIGGSRDIAINVRVICATNQDLMKLVEEKKFRLDLFYRINVIPFSIPPLRERNPDILLFISTFLQKFNSELKKEIKLSDDEVKQALIRYCWPGNVRELKNIIEYLVNIKQFGEIQLVDLPAHIITNHLSDICQNYSLKALVAEQERHILHSMLINAPTTQDKKILANRLGISLSSLYRKMMQYKLE